MIKLLSSHVAHLDAQHDILACCFIVHVRLRGELAGVAEVAPKPLPQGLMCAFICARSDIPISVFAIWVPACIRWQKVCRAHELKEAQLDRWLVCGILSAITAVAVHVQVSTSLPEDEFSKKT